MLRTATGLLAVISFFSINACAQTVADQTIATLVGPVTRFAAEDPTEKYEKELALDPGDAVSANNLAAIYFRSGRRDEAIDLLRRAAAAQPDVWNFHLNLSIALATAGDLDAALPYARRAVEQNDNHSSREELCTLLLTLRRAESAACYEVLVKDPEADSFDRVGYGGSLVLAGRATEAETVLRDALATQPRFAAAHNLLGVALFIRGKWKESAAELGEAVTLDPGRPEPRYNLGAACLKTGDRAASISQYRFLRDSSPELAEKLYRLIFADQVLYVSADK